jgi:hypothetical protein
MKLSFVPLFLSALGSTSASCDVDLFRMIGVEGPSADPIDIVKQDISTVTFNINNKWGAVDTDMDYVFVQYNDPLTGTLKCLSFADVLASWTSSEIEARCMVNKPISIVTLYVADANLTNSNVGELPPCCGADDGILGDALMDMTAGTNAASYTYVLECAPVACPAAECAVVVPAGAPPATPAPTNPPALAPGLQANIDANLGKSKHTTLEEVPVGGTASGPTCPCADKTQGMAEGARMVTGGGWIILEPAKIFLHEDYGSLPAGINVTANFGFNAKTKTGDIIKGSTNFVIDGKFFHFHSATGNTNYDYLEVPNGVQARWMGKGHLSTATGMAAEGDAYWFLVAVQDHGEPGLDDSFRISIYKGNFGETGVLIFDTNPDYPGHDVFVGDERFLGLYLGEDGPNGGGNIQIHKSALGKMVMLESDINCVCDKEGKINPTMAGGDSFVTGGGWIYLNEAVRNTTHNGCSGNCESNVDDFTKANFGFNAMRKKSDMLPDGSVNFDYNGTDFHFHSLTGGQAIFEFLEIPTCNQARWMGNGTLSEVARRALAPASETTTLYGFMVAVRDLAEPGNADEWRIRIWNIEEHSHIEYVKDADGNEDRTKPILPASYIFDTNPTITTDYWDDDRFLGTQMGPEVGMGGGNIQIHWRGTGPCES